MSHVADVLIAGGGLAGLVTAYSLIERGHRVLLIEKDTPEKLGGLARESFGGVLMIDTPEQRRARIADSPELAYRDWESFAAFGPDDEWPRRWARLYCENSMGVIHDLLSGIGVRFLPVVNWPERGLFRPGNSVPRWHVAWGTGHEIVDRLWRAISSHPRRALLEILFEHEVSRIEVEAGTVTGLSGRSLADGRPFRARGEHVVIASGGICGGDLSKLRANWHAPWGNPPRTLLNGAHRYGDGLLHDRVAELGGHLTHMDLQWHYASGVHHPAKRRPDDGLALVPPRSALWLNALGERIGPAPLMGYTDTRHVVETILKEPGQYSWQVLNHKIALRELAVSGCDYMTAFRQKKKLRMLRELLFGNRDLVDRLTRECSEDFVVAESLPELVTKMNAKSLDGLQIRAEALQDTIKAYDAEIERGPRFIVDDQLRRIHASRTYRGDRLRICQFQKILDPKAMPLIAIREFILARKSLGGIQTDLGCRILSQDGSVMPGLYAVGEAAGFGGGGIHGRGSLEGTFLGSCVLTGRVAGRTIAEGG